MAQTPRGVIKILSLQFFFHSLKSVCLTLFIHESARSNWRSLSLDIPTQSRVVVRT